MRPSSAAHRRPVALLRRGGLLVAAAALVVLPACGGDGDGGGGANASENAPVKKGARVIDVEGKSFEFTPDTIQMQAGEDVAIHLTSADVFHDFVVEGKGHVVGASNGDSAEGGLTIAKRGKYDFWCSIPGHRAAGMEGTIQVTL